jgi:hypothetical protein
VLVGELLGRVRAELPVIGGLGEREQVLVAAWLTGLRSARTRRAYAADVVAWLGWLAGRTGALAAGRVHVDLLSARLSYQQAEQSAASLFAYRFRLAGRMVRRDRREPGSWRYPARQHPIWAKRDEEARDAGSRGDRPDGSHDHGHVRPEHR